MGATLTMAFRPPSVTHGAPSGPTMTPCGADPSPSLTRPIPPAALSAAPPRLITQEAARLSTPALPPPDEPRPPPVRVDLPAGLAGGAVVRLPVFIVDDRNRCPSPRARLLAVPVDPQEVK